MNVTHVVTSAIDIENVDSERLMQVVTTLEYIQL